MEFIGMSHIVYKIFDVKTLFLNMQLPTIAGQICQISHPMEDENPADVYIVVEDPTPFDLDDEIYIVNLRELQLNLTNPAIATQIQVPKSGLNVIAFRLASTNNKGYYYC